MQLSGILRRVDSTKGSYAKEWAKWEKKLRETLFGNTEYLNAIQVHLLLFKRSNFCPSFKLNLVCIKHFWSFKKLLFYFIFLSQTIV